MVLSCLSKGSSSLPSLLGAGDAHALRATGRGGGEQGVQVLRQRLDGPRADPPRLRLQPAVDGGDLARAPAPR